MPELPEVETVMRGLSKVLEGQTLSGVTLRRPNLRFPFPDGFVDRLVGQRIDRLSRRAKYMLWHLSSGDTALLHLGMSGKFTITDRQDPKAKHDHVIFRTQGGVEVRYNDARRFGFMDLIPAGQTSRFLDALGPEPLGNYFNGAYLFEELKGRTSAVKARMLDQKVVVGVGNIYCSEALFQSRIRPDRPAGKVTQAEAETLATAIKDVLTRAIAAGGSSIRDYVQTDGELGYFQHAWAVYGREGEPCRACQTPIQRIVQSNRSSFLCPQCQP